MREWGDETVTFFEIDQPLCAHSYGNAPCQAVLGETGGIKCYNTRATCQDAANYSPGGVLTLRFSRPQEGLLQYGNVIPSISSISTTAASINLAGMDPSAAALGQREVVTIKFDDHLHSDHLVDPYRLERISGAASAEGIGHDPYERGTFWGKWLARNPYHSNYRCRVRQGVMGQPLEEMRVRHYVVDRIDGPTNGAVTLVAKDLFAKIEAKKAVAPRASRGALAAPITPTATSATLAPPGIGDLDYPASGRVRVGDEVMAFTRAGDTLTLTQRGDLNTEPAEHDTEDLVQLVLSYTTQRAHNIVYDLLTGYTAIAPDDIPKAQWDAEAEALPELYTGHITEPTPVQELIGELAEQAGFTVFPDVASGQVLFVALRPALPVGEVVDDRGWIVDGTLRIKRQVARRASQVWVYYAQISPTAALDERSNYRSRIVTIDPAAEGEQQYGTPAIREIFSRWIPKYGRAFGAKIGERILSLFRNPPVEARFAIHASRSLQLARNFRLRTADLQDATGAAHTITCTPIEIEQGENEHTIRAQQIQFVQGGGDPDARIVTIDTDENNTNLREAHDSIYGPPTGSDTVTFIIESGVVIGSTSTAQYALDTGDWPEGTELIIEWRGRVQGAGGRGGNGARARFGSYTPPTAGGNGGPAFIARRPVTIDMSGGACWGGGGGGAGGHAYSDFQDRHADGGGGGGGAGVVQGVGGSGYESGNSGSATTPGDGGKGTPYYYDQNLDELWGDPGGAGGSPGQPGQSSQMPGRSTIPGGAAGNAIEGEHFIAWIAEGDIRGPRV